MIVGTPLNKKLVKMLSGTRTKLRDACEDLGIDYDELIEAGDIGIDTCSHCSIWSVKLIPDLDQNPICAYCLDLAGM